MTHHYLNISEDHKHLYPMYIILALFTLLYSMVRFFIPLYLNDVGFTGTEIGIFYAAFSMVGLLFVFFIGVFTDRISPRVLVALSLFLLTIHLVGIVNSKSVIIMTMLFFIGGLGKNIFSISVEAFTIKNAKKEVGKEFGIYTLSHMIPFAIGLFIGGTLLLTKSYNSIITIVGLLILPIIFLVQFVPETKKSHNSANIYFKDFKNWKVITFILMIFVFTLHWGVENVAYTLLLKTRLGLETQGMGIFIGIPVIILGLAAFKFGKMADKGFSSKQLLITAFLFSGIGFLFLGLSTNFYLSLISRIVHEIGDASFTIFLFMGAKNFFKTNRMGGDIGLIALVTIIAQMAGALIFSPMGEAYGYHIPHIICGILMVISIGLVFLFKHNVENKKQAKN